MGWYRVIKTIKHHRYVYLQRTWREGKHVRTESRYICPVESAGGASPISPTRSKFAFHGAREGISGTPEPSSEGTFGAGFYLTDQDRAVRYASYDPKIAADFDALASKPPPQYDGTVTEFDLSNVELVTLGSWGAYYDLADQLLGEKKGYATPKDKAEMQRILHECGFDGIDVRDDMRKEIVIFPASLHKLKAVNTT